MPKPNQPRAAGRGRASRRRRRADAAAFAALAWLTLPALAQPPAASTPTRDELRERVRPAPGREGPALEVDGGPTGAPCALDRPEFAAIRFTPRAVAFDGLRGLPAADLLPAYRDFLGRDQPLAVICRIRDAAAAILRRAGYIAAIEVPEQRIEDGQVRLRVLMARLVALRVRGDAGRSERLLAAYLQHLAGGEVFNSRAAERYLLLASDLPGYNVRLTLRPAGTAPGEVIGEVTVVRLPGQLDLNLQNLGSRAVGREGALLRGQLFGLTGLGDRTTFAAYTTADLEEQQTVQLAHDFRIGGEGLQIAGQGTYAWARPDTGNPLLDLRSKTFFASLAARHPFVRSQRLSVTGGIGFDWSDQDVAFNALPLSRDHLRTVWATLDLAGAASVGPAERAARLGPRWQLDGGIELRQGLDLFGASPACGADFNACTAFGLVPPSRLEGRATATVARARLAGEARLTGGLTAFLGAAAQWASDPLLAFEEFSAGNYTIGRGYDPATLTGDRGVGFQAELRFGRLDADGRGDVDLQPYVFFDSAWIGNEDRLFVTAGRRDLRSLGGGVRAVIGDIVQLDASLAAPLVRPGLLAERPAPRLLLSVTTRLWPWRSR